MTPIPEISPMVETKPGDAVSAMCQELSAGLSLLSNFSDPFSSPESSSPSHNSFTSSTAATTTTTTSAVTAFSNVTTTVATSQSVAPTSQGRKFWLCLDTLMIINFQCCLIRYLIRQLVKSMDYFIHFIR